MKFKSFYKYMFLILLICVFLIPTSVRADFLGSVSQDIFDVSYNVDQVKNTMIVTFSLTEAAKNSGDYDGYSFIEAPPGEGGNPFKGYGTGQGQEPCTVAGDSRSVSCEYSLNSTSFPSYIPVAIDIPFNILHPIKTGQKLATVTVDIQGNITAALNFCDDFSQYKDSFSSVISTSKDYSKKLSNTNNVNSIDEHISLLNDYKSFYSNTVDPLLSSTAKFSSCSDYIDFKNQIDEIDKQFKIDEEKFESTVANSDLSQDKKDDYYAAKDDTFKASNNTLYAFDYGTAWGGEVDPSEDYCTNMYADIFDIVGTVYGWIEMLAPLLLVTFGVLDYGKAVISNDQEALHKVTGSFVKRAICTVAIFFLPLIVNLIFNMPGVSDLVRRVGKDICELTF